MSLVKDQVERKILSNVQLLQDIAATFVQRGELRQVVSSKPTQNWEPQSQANLMENPIHFLFSASLNF
jgi:hypothetical protein